MKTFLTLAVAALLVTGCAATNQKPDPGVQHHETADLTDVSSQALEAANQYGADEVLVVFDIDNTLLAMEQGLGSDQWYYWQKDLQKADACDPAVVGNRFAVQGALFFASAMRPTQPDAAEQVAKIQDAGIRTIALTSRGNDYTLQTFRELRRNGISFWPTALPPQRGWTDPFTPEGAERPTHYEDGVYLTAGQHKGEMLMALLRKTNTEAPGVIIMADDKQENLDAIEETFAGESLSLHVWRYTREDANVTAFDAQMAAQQWNELEAPLRQIQSVLGPDNFDLSSSVRPTECP